LWNWLEQADRSGVLSARNQPEGISQITVVVDANVGELGQGALEIFEDSRIALNQLFAWNIVSAFGDPNGNAVFGSGGWVGGREVLSRDGDLLPSRF
jgi:hypothetical protein